MKLPIPTIEGDVDLKRDFFKVISKMREENSSNLLMVERKNVLGTIVCRPKRDKLLEATASQSNDDGSNFCYKINDMGTSKTFFDAYIEQDRIKKILG